MKTGLLLEGGAMRGLFTAGVLDAFMEEGLRFDCTVGVSAGAAFGCNLKSQQTGRVLRYNTAYCRDSRYCSVKNLLTTGDLYGADFCYRALPDELDPFDYDAYRAHPMDFYCVCTDADTGEAVYKTVNNLTPDEFQYLRASASMPLVSRPVCVDGRRLLDGGIADSLPIDFLCSLGCNKNVAVLTRPLGYRKEPLRCAPLFRLALAKAKGAADGLLSRHTLYNRALDTLQKMEEEQRVFLLRPPKAIEVSTIERDPCRLKAAWQMGYDTAKNQMESLKNYLQN